MLTKKKKKSRSREGELVLLLDCLARHSYVIEQLQRNTDLMKKILNASNRFTVRWARLLIFASWQWCRCFHAYRVSVVSVDTIVSVRRLCWHFPRKHRTNFSLVRRRVDLWSVYSKNWTIQLIGTEQKRAKHGRLLIIRIINGGQDQNCSTGSIDLGQSIPQSINRCSSWWFTWNENGRASHMVFSVQKICSSLIRAWPSKDFESELSTTRYLRNETKECEEGHQRREKLTFLAVRILLDSWWNFDAHENWRWISNRFDHVRRQSSCLLPGDDWWSEHTSSRSQQFDISPIYCMGCWKPLVLVFELVHCFVPGVEIFKS